MYNPKNRPRRSFSHTFSGSVTVLRAPTLLVVSLDRTWPAQALMGFFYCYETAEIRALISLPRHESSSAVPILRRFPE